MVRYLAEHKQIDGNAINKGQQQPTQQSIGGDAFDCAIIEQKHSFLYLHVPLS